MFSAAWTRPSWCQNAVKDPAARSPRTTSSPGSAGSPRNSMPVSCWSEKKYGSSEWRTRSPRIVRAACAPWDSSVPSAPRAANGPGPDREPVRRRRPPGCGDRRSAGNRPRLRRRPRRAGHPAPVRPSARRPRRRGRTPPPSRDSGPDRRPRRSAGSAPRPDQRRTPARAGDGTRREDEAVLAERRSVGQFDPAAGRIDPLDRRARPEVDPLRGPERRILSRRLAAKIRLRQRRALVWRVRLGTDRHDEPSKPSLRSATAAAASACPAPTMTTPDTSSIRPPRRPAGAWPVGCYPASMLRKPRSSASPGSTMWLPSERTTVGMRRRPSCNFRT